jgi:hypothetical protein
MIHGRVFAVAQFVDVLDGRSIAIEPQACYQGNVFVERLESRRNALPGPRKVPQTIQLPRLVSARATEAVAERVW